MTDRKTLTLIDGSGFIFRAYHSLPPLTRSDGTPTGAVYGFINMMLKLMQEDTSRYMAVIFDAGRKTFRNRIYPEYKAHRPPAPDDLIPQFPLIREATEALNVPSIELEDYEADDIIATYAHQARAKGWDVIIVSSDKDLMQLIGDGVTMFDAMKQKTIGHEQVMEKFGVPPDKVRDALALIGDSSDNIPGVPGIGPKTAAELINQFGSLEGVLERAAEIKQNARRESITQNVDKARLSYELIGLCDMVPGLQELDTLILREPDGEKLITFLRLMGFKSLVAKMEARHGIAAQTEAPVQPSDIIVHYELVKDEATLKSWLAKAKYTGLMSLTLHTDASRALQANLIGFSLCIEPGKACYVPLNHVVQGNAADQGNLFASSEAATGWVRAPDQLTQARAIELLKPLLANPSVLKIGHNMKYDVLVLQQQKAALTPLDDVMLLSYCLDAGKHNHGLEKLVQIHFGQALPVQDAITGSGKGRLGLAQVGINETCAYVAQRADMTLRLWHHLKRQMESEQRLTLYETIERPLVGIIASIEARGIKVDRAWLGELSADFSKRLAVLEEDIYRLAGEPFNIGSPKQLGEVLFDKLGLAGGKKSKTGSYSTGADVLEELADVHPLPSRILDWRQLSKLKSTYTDALGEEINPATGRVHTSFAMAATTTGRLSSSEPNLQNIPIRTEEGRKIRHAFVAEAGNKLISADYSQIELRLLAHIADMEPLRQAFRNGDDIHALTASQMFGVSQSDVNSDLRRKAKTINFGIIYGISAHGLAQRLGISRHEAGSYIEAYFHQYPGIREYMERTKKFAREHGYVTTLYNRRCYLNGIADKNPAMRSFSERAAINAPLQGTAADIIKRAMIQVEHFLQGSPARMILQVHDELVIEVPVALAEATAQRVKQIMEKAAYLSVPLTVDTRIGNNWGEAH